MQNAPMIINVSAIGCILNTNKVVVPVKNEIRYPSILCGNLYENRYPTHFRISRIRMGLVGKCPRRARRALKPSDSWVFQCILYLSWT